MNKKKIFFVILFAIIILQIISFFKPKTKATAEIKTTQEIHEIFKRACYNCHSYETKWPFYAYIVPLSFWIDHHVKDGSRELNFSNWESLSLSKKAIKAVSIKEELDKDKMPPGYYTFVHKEAKLNSKEKLIIYEWVMGIEKENDKTE
jgi:hypothetical protein